MCLASERELMNVVSAAETIISMGISPLTVFTVSSCGPP